MSEPSLKQTSAVELLEKIGWCFDGQRWVLTGDILKPYLSVPEILDMLPTKINDNEFRRAARRIKANRLSTWQMMIRREDIDAILMEIDRNREWTRNIAKYPRATRQTSSRGKTSTERALERLRELHSNDKPKKKR